MQVTPPHKVPTKKRAVLGQLSDMDLRLLKVFKSVVDCGGIAAAELELNVGTSTVSRHVKDLETRTAAPNRSQAANQAAKALSRCSRHWS